MFSGFESETFGELRTLHAHAAITGESFAANPFHVDYRCYSTNGLESVELFFKHRLQKVRVLAPLTSKMKLVAKLFHGS